MKTRVLFLLPSINFGGAELLAIQQIQWLQANGTMVFVGLLSSKNDKILVEKINSPNANFLCFNSPYSVLNVGAVSFALKDIGKLGKFVNINKVDVIVAHLPLAHFWGRLLKLKVPSIKLLVYHHSMQYQASPLNTFAKKIFNNLNKVLAARTDDVSICISEAVKENIQAHFILNNPVVLYNAVVDKCDTVHQDGYNSGEKKNSVKLVLPGRLHPAKGHMFFLKVFLQLVQELSVPLELVIAGGGPLEQQIADFVHSNGLAGNVILTGFVENESILEYIKSADYVVIPSLSEGLGIVAIEALMLGKTIIASDTGGLKEIIHHGQNGYLFQAGFHNSCLNLFHNVLSDFPASKLPAVLLRNDYLHRFSFDAHISRFVELIKKAE